MNSQEREALKLALEAFEAKGDAWIVLERKAKAAIKEALAQRERDLKPKCFADFQPNHEHDRKCQWCAVELECKTGVAQPAVTESHKQEPVGINGLTETETNATASVMGLVNTTPPTQQSCSQRTAEQSSRTLAWVGLTDEEVERLAHHELWVKIFIREIEEKLRSKNT